LTPSGADTFMLVQPKDRDGLDYSASPSSVTVRQAALQAALSVSLQLPLIAPKCEELLSRADSGDNSLSLTTNKVVQIDQALSQLAALSKVAIACAF